MTLREEIKARPGDYVFLPIFTYALIAMSWEWLFAAFLVGWGVNLLFGIPSPTSSAK